MRFGFDGKGGRTILETARRLRTSPTSVKRAMAAAALAIEWALKSEGWNSERVARLRPETFIKVS